MKRLTALALGVGLVLLTALVAWAGAAEVGDAVARVGWGTLLVALARAAAVTAAGLAWWCLFPPDARPGAPACVVLRWTREGVNTLLPVAQVGGDILAARLLTFFGVAGSLAGASVLADMLVQVATQFAFTVLGLGQLIALGADAGLAWFVGGGLALSAPLLVGFYVAQRRGGHRLVRAVLDRLAGGRDWLVLGAVDDLFARLAAVYARRRGIAACAAIHMATWIFGAVEVWLAFHFMGHPVSYGEALVIESLGHAVRGAAFAVPGAIGVQEGGFIALCAVFGIPPEAALALSLVKRVGDLAVGLPGLLAWQVLEGRRALRT